MSRGIFQYGQDIINDSSKSIKTTYSSNKIEEMLSNAQVVFYKTTNILTEKSIGANQVVNNTDITSNVSDLKIGQLVYDTDEILGRIVNIDTTNNKVTVETIHSNTSGSGGCVTMLGTFSTAPTTFAQDDVYYNTTDKLVYTCEDGITWNSGAQPEKDLIYISKNNHMLYCYSNNQLELYGGGAIAISSKANNAITQETDGVYTFDYGPMVSKLQGKKYSGLDKGYYFLSGTTKNTNTWNAGYSLITFIKNSLGTGNYIEKGDIQINSSGYAVLTEGVWSLSAGTINNSANAIDWGWKDSDGNLLGNYGYVSPGATSDSDIDANAIVEVPEGQTLAVAPIRISTNGSIEQTFSFVRIHRIGTTDVDPVAYLSEDGNLEETPVGSIISYFGTTAPKHYLACDGTEYNINDYSELALHIKEQFGSINYFGGDGTITFAVPDLRGEFLRGSGTNSHIDQGNGASVGTHQDATTIPANYQYINGVGGATKTQLSLRMDDGATASDGNYGIKNQDSAVDLSGNIRAISISASESSSSMTFASVGVRPTNTSVLYCIKYETTHKILFGDQTTYKVSVPITYNFPQTAQMVWAEFDTTNAEDDISMLGTSKISAQGDAFVAPMDGYYHATFMFPEQADIPGTKVTYHSTYVYKNGVVIGGSDRQDNSTNIRVPLNESFTLKLKKGDTINVGMYMAGQTTAFTRNGLATFCLVNTLNENKTAELMNKPNTWVVGQEYDFGDGLYGQRFTGTINTTAGKITNQTLLSSGMTNCVIYQRGGFWVRDAAYTTNNRNFSIGDAYISGPSTAQVASSVVINGDTLELCILDNSTHSTNYDVWIKYTKQ